MFRESEIIESLLRFFRHFIPESIFLFFQPLYHRVLSLAGALVYGFPARGMTIIGVTGTKGKSTTVMMIAKALEAQGVAVAAIGSLGFKIKEREWPNNLHMTMPGRMKLQRFLYHARNAGVTHVVLEATSEGMAQGRIFAVPVDGAVLTNLHPEHIERHGSIENYIRAKQILFRKAKNIHVVNFENPYKDRFRSIHARKTVFFGMQSGGTNQKELNLKLSVKGDFNIFNALAALATIRAYGFDVNKARETIEAIDLFEGRMEYIYEGQDFNFVVDYAHTPESLEAVYKNLKQSNNRLICIFGSDGGGRDTWKRPVFGKIASQYCDEVILTSENPYNTDPDEIADEIERGMENKENFVLKRIIDRRNAMQEAVKDSQTGDTIVITGKGTEDSIVVANGKKIPWLDSKEARKAIQESQKQNAV